MKSRWFATIQRGRIVAVNDGSPREPEIIEIPLSLNEWKLLGVSHDLSYLRSLLSQVEEKLARKTLET